MSENILGLGTRLSERHTELLSSTVYKDEIDLFGDYEYLFSIGDLAHLLCLEKSKVYEKNKLIYIVKYLNKEINDRPNFSSSYSGNNGDFFSNRLKRLRNNNELGIDAELINCGRPRRESTNIAFTLLLKEKLLILSEEINLLAEVIAEKSIQSNKILFTDFTYWHSTQPSSFGHFLSSYLGGLDRQMKLLLSIYEIFDMSPAGAGSSNGTMLGLDREYHSRLLGFNDLINNTKDATWAIDSFCSISNWINLFSGMLCKMTEDFLTLCNDGFKVIQCADKHSRISVIMPHKKNPYQLSICRGKFLEISAKSHLYLSALAKSSGYPDSRHIFYKDLPRDIEELKNNIVMLRDVISLFKINEKESNKLAYNKNIYSADIAQELLLKYKITDREAHKILSDAITYSESQSKELNINCLNSILKTRDLPLLENEDFAKLTDPNYILSRRSEIGSANPEILLKNVRDKNVSIGSSLNKILKKRINLSYLNSEVKNFLLN
tara:strand:- start:1378 stop:2859 length:1482 start_codon:yes stop_codon:yes gene_type:complete